MNGTKRALALLLCLCLLLILAPAASADTITLSLSTEHRLADYTKLEFSEAYASSELFAEGILWTAKMAIDGAYGTSWQEGVKGYGEGESITAVFAQPQQVDMLCLRLGYSACYEENGVPKDVDLVFSDGSTASYTFPHNNQDFYVLLSRPVTTDYVKLIIRSAYKGLYNADTCVTEIAAYQSKQTAPVYGDTSGAGTRLVEKIDGQYRTLYSYDRAGRLSQETEYYRDSIDYVTEYHYYPDGSLFEELYKGGINLYWHYDSKGTRIEQDDTGGIGSPVYATPYSGDTVHSEYDAAGHLTRMEVSYAEGGKRVFRYEYDAQGRITRFRAGDTLTETVDYKPDGSFIRMRQYTDMNLYITEYYNADGLRTQQDYRRDGSLSSTYEDYDARGNLIRRTHSGVGIDTMEWRWDYDGHGNRTAEWSGDRLITSYQNQYDARGNLIQVTETTYGSSSTVTYRYE